ALIALAARRWARSAEDTPRSNTTAKFRRAAMKAKPSRTRTGRKVANRDHPWRWAEAGGAPRPRFPLSDGGLFVLTRQRPWFARFAVRPALGRFPSPAGSLISQAFLGADR